MAFSPGNGTFVEGNDSSSVSTWSPATSATNWDAGDLLVVYVGLDNLGTSDGETSTVTLVEIQSAGVTTETFTKAVEYSNGSPGAANGATVAVWYCVATASGPPATATCKVTFSSAVTKKAITSFSFNRDTSKSVQVMTGSKATGEARSITSGTITNGVHALVVRGIALEDNENAIDSSTSADWSSASDGTAFTSGGGATANICVGGEHRIMTGAGAGVTSNPTGGATGDTASAIIAFLEVSLTAPVFRPYQPVTPLLLR